MIIGHTVGSFTPPTRFNGASGWSRSRHTTALHRKAESDVDKHERAHHRDHWYQPGPEAGVVRGGAMGHIYAEVDRRPCRNDGQASQPVVQAVPSLADVRVRLGADETNQDLVHQVERDEGAF